MSSTGAVFERNLRHGNQGEEKRPMLITPKWWRNGAGSWKPPWNECHCTTSDSVHSVFADRRIWTCTLIGQIREHCPVCEGSRFLTPADKGSRGRRGQAAGIYRTVKRHSAKHLLLVNHGCIYFRRVIWCTYIYHLLKVKETFQDGKTAHCNEACLPLQRTQVPSIHVGWLTASCLINLVPGFFWLLQAPALMGTYPTPQIHA